MAEEAVDVVAMPKRPARRAGVATASMASNIPAWTEIATVSVCMASALVSLIAALTRGPWIDEFWTLFAIDPQLPLATVFRLRWLTDVHPPLFYLLTRLTSQVMGGAIEELRLQNVIPMSCMIALFFVARVAWRGGERFLMLYAILAFTSYFATGYFAELRSYYLQFVCGIGFYGSAYYLVSVGVTPGQRPRGAALATFCVTCVMLVNLHFVTALLVAISLVGLILTAALLGQRRLSVLTCVIGAIAWVPLIGDLAIQGPYLVGRAGGQFWIETGFVGAVGVLIGSIVKGVGANVAACLLAGYQLALWSVAPGQSVGRERVNLVFGGTLLLSVGVSICVILAINIFTPVIVDRYLLLCSSALICAVAVLAQNTVFSLRFGFPLVMVNAALFLGIVGVKLINEPRWNATTAIIGRQVAQCPTTSVEGLPFPYANTLANEPRVFALGYHYLADRYGFRVVMTGHGGEPAQDATGHCPTVVWIEHVPWARLPSAESVERVAERVFWHADLSRSHMISTKTGALIIIPPDQRK